MNSINIKFPLEEARLNKTLKRLKNNHCSSTFLTIFFLLISFQTTSMTFIQDEVLVRPESNGSLRLNAEKGKAIGPDIKYMPEWKAYGWFRSKDRVEWNVLVKNSGEYDVFLEWSVSDEEAGKPFVLIAGAYELKNKVAKSGSWETFKSMKIGSISLSEGQQLMIFKPASEFTEGALLDLREVILVPSETKVSAPNNSINKSRENNTVNIYCNESNDLYQLLKTGDLTCKRFDNIDKALESTPNDQTLMILAKGYPNVKTILPKNFYRRAKEKNLKVYVEFPNRLESEKTGEISTSKKERLVITSGFFGERLNTMDILDAGLYSYVGVADRFSHIKGAKVAGFKNAVYGLENSPNFPILFEDGNVLISTTKLSDFKKSRYSPYNIWREVIGGILSKLSIRMDFKEVKWEAVVKPTFEASATLSQENYRSAVNRGAAWYMKSKFLIHPDWKGQWLLYDTVNPPVGPPMDLSLPSGDGSLGVMEGHYSYINPDGSQQYRYWLRADCVAETAMTFAMANDIKENSKYLETSTNLMDFLFNTETFTTDSSRDSSKSSYGLIGWADTNKDKYYGDDNARVILGSILASQAMGNNNWDKQIVELILANFRTSGIKGFRSGALKGLDIDQTTWQVLMKRDLENVAPHYESWLWATYLWLYNKTGYEPLLEKAKKAIEITMANYPENWKWTNGLQQERARMILPLAWLVRVDDNKKHREWLNWMCTDLLKYQVACGALREELGTGSNGKYGAPVSNAHYGTTEAPIIHANGEPVGDMLYTTNFAFFALNEAACATNNPIYLEAVDKMADFLIRIQTTSTGRLDLDGCWFRAFDYENWEYYGSNADSGWGAWGTLTGWTQSFITTTLALKLKKTSFWDITAKSIIGNDFDETLKIMLPERSK